MRTKGNKEMILDLLVISRCHHPSSTNFVKKSNNVINIIVSLVEEQKFRFIWVSPSQKRKYLRYVVDYLQSENYAKVLMFLSHHKPLLKECNKCKYKGKAQYHKDEYEELKCMIKNRFLSCLSDVVIICVNKRFSHDELELLLKQCENNTIITRKTIDKIHGNTEILLLAKQTRQNDLLNTSSLMTVST